GAFAETFSTATVVSPAAPRSPGRGNAGSFGTNLLARMNRVQTAAGPEWEGGTVTTDPSAASAAPLLPSSTAVQSAQPQRADDLYWQLLSQGRGDSVIDPNGWAAHELALALEPSTV